MMGTILVCVTVQRECERLITAGKRLADSGGNKLKVLHVAEPNGPALGNPDTREALNSLYALSRQEGAEMTVLYNEDVRVMFITWALCIKMPFFDSGDRGYYSHFSGGVKYENAIN